MSKLNHTCVLSLIMAAVLSAGILAASSIEVGEPAPTFQLEDQFGKDWDLADLKDSVVVVIAANDKSGRDMEPWVDNLKSSYGAKIQLLGLMDLHKVPGLARGIAKSRIRKETQDPLMLDFKGSVSKLYLVNSENPVVVVIDKNGIVKDIEKAEYSDSAYKKCTNAINKAIKAN